MTTPPSISGREARRHPDLFTKAEAMEYLHLGPDQECTIKGLRDKGLLEGVKIGPEFMYHRDELDAAVSQLFAERLGFIEQHGARAPVRTHRKVGQFEALNGRGAHA